MPIRDADDLSWPTGLRRRVPPEVPLILPGETLTGHGLGQLQLDIVLLFDL
jgi:hypothetical protein